MYNVHSVHSLQVHGNESQVFELCFSHNPKHNYYMYMYMYNIMCHVNFVYMYVHVHVCIQNVQYNYYVNKKSPYSNSNYLSYTVSIV